MSRFATLILFLFLVAGCIDTIDFDVERSGNQLVVDGGIIDRPGPYELKLWITVEDFALPQPLSGALITIIDGSGNREEYVEAEPGLYRVNGDIVQGRRGESYFVEIRLPNGQIYRSEPETIPTAIGKDRAYVEVGTISEQSASGRTLERPAVFVYTDTELPGRNEPVWLRWTVESVYRFGETVSTNPFGPPPGECYVTQDADPQRIPLFLNRNVDSDLIAGKLVAVKRVMMHEFFFRHYFNVIQFSITEQRHRYWEKVEEMINRTGTIFDTPPATIKGNVYNTEDEDEVVLGYFEAAAVDTSRTFTASSDFEFHIPDPCSFSNPNRHEACRNCLELSNSSRERPWYFGL